MSLSHTISLTLCFSNGGGDSVCVPGALSTVISAGQWSHWCYATCTAHQRCESAITIYTSLFSFFFKTFSYARTFCPFKTPFVCFKVSDNPKFSHARHSVFLFPPIPSIFHHCCTSLHIPAAHYTRFRPFICFYRSLPPEKCWVPCLTSSAPCAWMPVVCTHLCSASPSSGCSRCCSHQTTCLPCAADAALTH